MSYTRKFVPKIFLLVLVMFALQSTLPNEIAYAASCDPNDTTYSCNDCRTLYPVENCFQCETPNGGVGCQWRAVYPDDGICPDYPDQCDSACVSAGAQEGSCSGSECLCSGENPKPIMEIPPDCQFQLTEIDTLSRCAYGSVKGDVASGMDMRRTVMDMAATLASDAPMYITTGKGIDQATACMCKVGSCSSVTPNLQELMDSLTLEDCRTFSNNPLAVAAGVETPPPYASYSGSLAGLIMKGTTVAYSEPLPISLAYYTKDLASKIPFLKNTAFAQEIKTSMFPGFAALLKLWQLVRNFSFAIVAVFMTVTGMMIMMRKQTDARTAVTVQYALPRLVISLALIAFSYAIGALFIALIGPLTSVALEPIRMAAKDKTTQGPIATFLVMLWGSSGGVGITFVTFLLYLVAFLVLLFVFAGAIFKLMISYIEALVLIVIAPLQFAWGSIPGNEDAIKSWFKAMAVAVLSIPAVTAALSFGLYFAWTSAKQSAIESSKAGIVGPFASDWYNAGIPGWITLLTPIMVIGIFMFASKLPDKIKEAILDKRA